jgi:hypothetical protein
MKRISKGAKRIHGDYSRALTLRSTSPDGRQTILVVGNSLLVVGVDRVKLAASLFPEYSVSLLPIENTTYLDWYFGLRRIFAEGARPFTVVLCLSPKQLISDSVNGAGFAHHMMQLRDLRAVAKAAGLDLTTTSVFFFAHLSSWLGDRESIRNWLLETTLPNANLLISSLIPRIPPPAKAEQRDVSAGAVRRLVELRDLSAAYGTRFLFLIPPLTSDKRLAEEISLAGERSGLTVLMPFVPGEMGAGYFSDGFHLKPEGASTFTERLGRMLRSALR